MDLLLIKKYYFMKTLYFASITSLFFLFSCGSFDSVWSVQEGSWYACPDATNKQLIDNGVAGEKSSPGISFTIGLDILICA